MTVYCYHPICSQIKEENEYSPKAYDTTCWMFWQLSIPTAHQLLTYFGSRCAAGQKAMCQPTSLAELRSKAAASALQMCKDASKVVQDTWIKSHIEFVSTDISHHSYQVSEDYMLKMVFVASWNKIIWFFSSGTQSDNIWALLSAAYKLCCVPTIISDHLLESESVCT